MWPNLKITILTKNKSLQIDKILLIAVAILSLIGLVAVFNSSIVVAFRTFGDPYHFVKSQALFLSIGFIFVLVISKIDYHNWYYLAVPLLFLTLVLLVAVFIPGIGVKALGAKRWVNFRLFILQPTEVAKFTLVVYLSAWFSHREKKRFVPFLVLLGLVLLLVIIQPDMGTAVIIGAIAILLYFASGAPFKHFLYVVPVILVVGLLVAIMVPYRLVRLTTYFNIGSDPLGSSYHIRQVLLALGSGGWFGVGLGKSRQKYDYVPEANTDSIFAIIAEEVGFAGSIIIIGLFVLIVYRMFTISKTAPDRFGSLLASGIGFWFGIQTIINLGAMVALIPLTGVPLPLVSYGGSNLVTILSALGVLLNISRQKKSS